MFLKQDEHELLQWKIARNLALFEIYQPRNQSKLPMIQSAKGLLNHLSLKPEIPVAEAKRVDHTLQLLARIGVPVTTK